MFWAVLVTDLVQAAVLSHLDYCTNFLHASPALFSPSMIHSLSWLPDSITPFPFLKPDVAPGALTFKP